MTLFFAKIACSVAAVLFLAAIAEKVSPRAAGIMSGFPLGTAIALYFIGHENGIAFATAAAVYCLPGLLSAMMAAAGYWVGLKLFHGKSKYYSAFGSAFAAFLSFLIPSYLLSLFDYTIWTAALVPVIAIPLLTFLFKRIENVRLEKPVKTTALIIGIRASSAASIVLGVTAIAHVIGPNWSGLLAAFPVSMLPFLMLLHLTYGEEYALTVIKNFPMGLGALVVFTTTVYFSFPHNGALLGTLISYGAAILYLLAYAFLLALRKRKTIP